MQALNELRNNLGRLRAQATMSEEMQNESLDSRINKYKQAVRSDAAKAKFLQRVEQSKALTAGTGPSESAGESAAERFSRRRGRTLGGGKRAVS